jgi:glycerol-3-phosphate acyltransferase PlsY
MFVLEGLIMMRDVAELYPRIAFMVLILWRHRSNYQRILQGKENKANI